MKTIELTDYPTATFTTFEDSILANVNGRSVPVALMRGGDKIPSAQNSNDQETYNLIYAMTKRASVMPELLSALKWATQCLEWHSERHGVAMDAKVVEDAKAAIAKAAA